MAQIDEDEASLLRRKAIILAVALEKCGTTSLNNFLGHASNVSSPWPKELQYFSSQYEKGVRWFLGHHNTSKDILVDFSPNYHRSDQALLRIQADCERKAIVIVLRHPIQRAFSAYTHIRYWFFERDFLDGKGSRAHAKTFAELIGGVKPFLFPSYTQLIDRIYSTFGRSIVTVIPMEHMLKDVWSFLRPVEEILGCSIALDHEKAIPRSNALYMPQFFTGRQLLDMEPEAVDLVPDIEATYFVRGGMPRKIAEGGMYRRLKEMEENWLRPLNANAASKAFVRYYESETAQIEKMLGVRLDAWRVFKEYRARTIRPLSEEAARKNVEVGLWHAQRLLAKKKAPDQAVAFLRELIASQPHEPQFHHLLAEMLHRAGDLDGGRTHSLIAETLAPQDPRFGVRRSNFA